MLLIRYINFIACPLLQLLSELNNKITQTKKKIELIDLSDVLRCVTCLYFDRQTKIVAHLVTSGVICFKYIIVNKYY